MTYEWARWLKPAIEADPVLKPRLIEISGWESRGRPPSQYSFFPSGVIDHHTACFCRIGHDPQSCINGILSGNSSAPGPISQLLVTLTPPGVKWNGSNLDPRIILIAAGRSNHAGTGTYRWGAPGGNGSSIGIEGCGPLEFWPPLLVEIRERLTAALLRNRNWTAEQSDTHYGYATPKGRKIDPSGAWEPQPELGLLHPWHPDILRGRVAARLVQPPPTPPRATFGEKMQYQQLTGEGRVLDTRNPGNSDKGGNNGQKVAAGSEITVHAYRLGLPEGTKAVAINITAANPEQAGFLSAWPSGTRPNMSCCNYGADPNVAVAGFTIVNLSGYGTFQVFSAGKAHVIVDIVGAFV